MRCPIASSFILFLKFSNELDNMYFCVPQKSVVLTSMVKTEVYHEDDDGVTRHESGSSFLFRKIRLFDSRHRIDLRRFTLSRVLGPRTFLSTYHHHKLFMYTYK